MKQPPAEETAKGTDGDAPESAQPVAAPAVVTPLEREHYTSPAPEETRRAGVRPDLHSPVVKHEGEPGRPVHPDTGDPLPPDLAGDQPES